MFCLKNISSFILHTLKKIFILIPWFQPAFKAGGPIQSIAGLVKHLAIDDLSFNIVCSNKDRDGTVLNVPTNEWVKYNDSTQVWYSADNNIVPIVKTEIAKQPNAILYIIGIYDWAYNIKPLLFVKGIKKIVSVRGMLHPGALTQKGFKKKTFLFFMKLWGWKSKCVFHVTDEYEKEFVRTQLGIKNEELRIMVAGNLPNLFSAMPVPVKEPGKLKLVSVGLISPMKNYLPVLNALRQGQGDIEYSIYGPVKDAAYWEECKNVIAGMPDNIVVNYYGAIAPLAVEAALKDNHVFILPSKSENFGHSIIEALSMGRPVITSNNTPWNKLMQAKAGINVNVEKENELTEAVHFFIKMTQAELDEWSACASVYADEAIDMEAIKMQYINLFHQ